MASRRRKKAAPSTKTGATAPSQSEDEPPSGDAAPKAGLPSDALPPETSPLPTIALPPLSRILSVVMLILGIVVVGVLFFQVMVGFFVPLFLAALLTVIFRPIHAWLLAKTRRKRIAATVTTTLVLLVVLVPVITVISVAASQFTSMVSQVDFDKLSLSLDKTRDQFGLSLEDPEKFRRLDQIADSLDAVDRDPNGESDLDTPGGERRLRSLIAEAIELIDHLEPPIEPPIEPEPGDETDGIEGTETAPGLDAAEPSSEPGGEESVSDQVASEDEEDVALPIRSPEAALAIQRLTEFDLAVQEHQRNSAAGPLDRIVTEEDFHRRSVNTSAAIRSWMRAALGGTLWSQIRLLSNPSAEDFKGLLNRVRESLQPRFVSLTSRTGSYLIQLLIGLAVLVIAVYFFLVDGSKMTRTLMRLSPLDDSYEAQLLQEFDRTSRAVVLASALSALVQGMLAAVAYYFLGFNSLILLFMLTTMMALVPFLGAASVWMPCAVYLATVEQRMGAAIFLAIYGATVVSSIDNVIKMYVLHGRSTLHPLFALLSVLGGVSVFGPIGILVGPMVVVFLQTLLEILAHELDQDAADSGHPRPSSSVSVDRQEPVAVESASTGSSSG